MPWSADQRTAIFLSVQRKKGKAAAIRLMHRHGYGGKHPGVDKSKPRKKAKAGR